MTESDLMAAARSVQGLAYAPYSKFQVGAAVRTSSGQVFLGCNVENIAYPQGTCAEAGAIAAMIAGGERQISEVAVIAGGPAPVAPCGGCRQKLREFAGPETPVSMGTLDGQIHKTTLGALLPGAFGPDQMGQR